MWAGFIWIMTETNDTILFCAVSGYYPNKTFPRCDLFLFLINRGNINAEQTIFRPIIHSLLAILKPTTMAQIEDL